MEELISHRQNPLIDVINSKNEFALKSSIEPSFPVLFQKKLKKSAEMILHEIAFIESALDDPEHISLDGYPEKLSSIVSECDKKN